MLSYIAKHSPIFMPLCALIGFLLPELSNAVLAYLPAILFFLMFFTLLGIDQRALYKKMAHVRVVFFSIYQNALMCLVVTISAFMLGVRGDLLLALSAISATAPLFGSGAIANAIGFDALAAMAKTIVATLLFPFVLAVVLAVLGTKEAHLDLYIYAMRLFVYIITPMVLAVVVKKLLPEPVFKKLYPKVARVNILLVLSFPLGLMGGFRETFDHNVSQAFGYLGLAFLLSFIFYFSAYFLYKKHSKETRIVAALASSGRNVLLTYAVATPFLGSVFLPLIGALQIPMFSLPFLARFMAKDHVGD